MVREDLRVCRQLYQAVFERSLVTRHIVAIPLVRKHHLSNPGAVTLHRGFSQVLSVSARVHRPCDESGQSICDVKQHLFLLTKWYVAQLDYERCPSDGVPLEY